MKVFITGCTSKLGVHITKAFKQNGFEILGHYYNQKDLAVSLVKEKLVTKIFQADFTTQVDDLINNLVNSLPIDVLINNASIFKPDTNFSNQIFNDHLHINALAAIQLTQAIATNQTNHLKVINILDAMLLRGTKAHFSYYLSKKMLENASFLLKQNLKNISIKNLYLPKMTSKLKIERLNQNLLNFAK